MAPKRGESIERNDEYDKFISELATYHEKRGYVLMRITTLLVRGTCIDTGGGSTHLDTEPRIGVRRISLKKLYARVVEEGGYDAVSDTKAKPLMWRKFAEEFVGKNVYSAAQAFQIKQIYYKNLVAYEISNHWKQEPPPKEILEDVSAKGGNVMTRTLENYAVPVKDDAKDRRESAGSPEQTTPGESKTALDDPGSASGRTTRGLRQQPPQRVLFQPDINPARQTRGSTISSPGPGLSMNGMPNGMIPNGTSSTLASYEPSQSYPLSLKPVVTPSNNPEYYRNERKRKLEANAGPLARKYRNIMLPGTGFIGPNIYVRAQLALQSGMPDEERYALHHLVKISHERGDKYRFDQFPGLAEALARKILSASSLFYDVEWDVDYDDDTFLASDETLNGIRGTANIIKKLKERPLPLQPDDVVDAGFLDQINRVTEAALVFRNMCTMDDNARYVASFPLTRDVIAVAISLPNHWTTTELRNYMLETAELTLRYCDVNTHQDLYASLLEQVESQDRGTAVLAMRIISRIAMLLPVPKKLENVSTGTLQRIQDWLLVEDEELRAACLDFLMQYTTFADNVDLLLQAVDGEVLARQLSRLLLFNAKEISSSQQQQHLPPNTATLQHEQTIPPVPRLSSTVVAQLLKLEEPERSSEWLRMCFRPDTASEMTQISLWQAYQATFGPYASTHGNLIAGEFIKNVSAVFTGATAQVAGQNKYVIKGIRSRKVPVETGVLDSSRPGSRGAELVQCRWTVPLSLPDHGAPTSHADCGEWFQDSDTLLRHVLQQHLRIPLKRATRPEANGDAMEVDFAQPDSREAINGTAETLGESFDFAAADATRLQCTWSTCRHTVADLPTNKAPPAVLLARHIATHLPDRQNIRHKHDLRPDQRSDTRAVDPMQLSVLTDEKHHLTGIPLSAALILSHIAKFLPTNAAASKGEVRTIADGATEETKAAQAGQLIEELFGAEVKDRMFLVLAHCPPARMQVNGILSNIRRSSK